MDIIIILAPIGIDVLGAVEVDIILMIGLQVNLQEGVIKWIL